MYRVENNNISDNPDDYEGERLTEEDLSSLTNRRRHSTVEDTLDFPMPLPIATSYHVLIILYYFLL